MWLWAYALHSFEEGGGDVIDLMNYNATEEQIVVTEGFLEHIRVAKFVGVTGSLEFVPPLAPQSSLQCMRTVDQAGAWLRACFRQAYTILNQLEPTFTYE